MDQHRGSSRPRPANTSHCQKSGTLELKGQKSKVFAALSLPEMWLYKSEQVGGQTRHPTVPMVDGGEWELSQGQCQRESRKEKDGQEKGNGGDPAWGSHSGSLGLEMLGLPGEEITPISSLLPNCLHLSLAFKS